MVCAQHTRLPGNHLGAAVCHRGAGAAHILDQAAHIVLIEHCAAVLL